MGRVSRVGFAFLLMLAAIIGCGGSASPGLFAGTYNGVIAGQGSDFSYATLSVGSSGAVSGTVQPMFGPESGVMVSVSGTLTNGSALSLMSTSPANMSLTITGVVSTFSNGVGQGSSFQIAGNGSETIGMSQESVTIDLQSTANYGMTNRSNLDTSACCTGGYK